MRCKNCKDCGDCPPPRNGDSPSVGGSDATRYLSLPNEAFNGGGETWRSAPIAEPPGEKQHVVVDPNRSFYVSCWNGQRGPQFAAVSLLGPFDDHQDALNRVDECRRLAQEADPKAAFYAFGTCSTPRENPTLKTVFRLNENGEVVL